MISAEVQLTCRYRETTAMGFAGETSYLPWLEMARAELLRAHGMDYRQFEIQGFLVPVFEVGLTFLRPVHYDDAVTVVTTLRQRPTFRFRLDYEIRVHDLRATAYTIQGFINRAYRPVRPPADFMAAVDQVFPRSR